ncbi:MAG: carbohydrate binding family 9 domain-containing protein, partial [Marinilabiliales bacterium]|nr:carbohydrate binding family 9 domain-containing protein [Marinilabiliales bacterium]
MIKLSLLTLLLALSLLSAAAERGSEAVSPKHTRDSVSVRTAINAGYKIHAHRTTGNIHLDGIPDEPDWKRAETAGNFYMVLPYDTGHCKARSEIRLTYDDKAFYLALVFHDTVPGKRPVESLRRDFVFGNNDNFLLFIDPFNDQTTGYSFGVNAAGALWDGTMSGGSAVNLVWDCKWDVKVRNDSDRWCAEMRIPFKSIRYKSGIDHWNIQFSRLDLKLNEKSAWAPVPRQFPTASLAYAGQLIWDTPPPRSGIHLSLIPSIFGSISRNFETGDATHYKRNFGLDAKLGLSTALNLDLTYHPDFSQAEVDDQVINLDRFELYFPEKRQFFLENSDLFANFGNAQVR